MDDQWNENAVQPMHDSSQSDRELEDLVRQSAPGPSNLPAVSTQAQVGASEPVVSFENGQGGAPLPYFEGRGGAGAVLKLGIGEIRG